MSEEKRHYGPSIVEKLHNLAPLHPAEAELISYIRTLQFGTLTVKVQHGLPEVGEEVRKIKFNTTKTK